MVSKRPVIVVIGASNIDLVVKSSRFPRPGETVSGGGFFIGPGGKGANQAVAAARLGAKVYFVARIGKDIFGNKIISGLKKARVNIDYVVCDPKEPSGTALIVIDKNGENSIVFAPGANSKLSQADIEKAKSVIILADILVLQLETSLAATEYAANLAHKYHIPILLNPAPASGKLSTDFLNKVDVLTPNETEIQELTGIKVDNLASAKAAAEVILETGVKTVVLTMGKKGALLVTRDKTKLIPAKKVKALDTTGSGDAFSGALAFSLVKGKEISEAVRFACGVASLSVTRMGTQASMPTLDEVKIFRRNWVDRIF
ncbi:MAG: ribokinase [Candidatus Omnitrophota bacterium]